ncbi:MAG: universal stress protein [Propionibacteriaceae bacterium]|jgi:nucleotide-binding universal stress UspA family protein|nr:universal stress protein [Propionibacteriaceae bacterium]
MTGSIPRILVGIDGSDDGIRAARYGIGRAKRLDGDLWFVNAVDDGVVTGGWGIIYDPTVLKEAGQAAVEQAADLATAMGVAADRIRTDVVIGNPTTVLAEFSKEAEILIVGRRASSGIERMFVGSTSTTLAAATYCPLVVISAASTPEPTGRYHRVTVAMGGSGDKPLRWACQEARTRPSTIDVVHVIPYQPTSIVSFLPATAAQERQWEERVLAGLKRMVEPVPQQFSDLEIRVRSQRGVLADELIQESSPVDLLVLGVKPRPAMSLGGPLRAVLAHAACPVALISR